MSDYLLLPFLTWLITGICKFLINCLREKRFAFDLVGYGGFPSNHSAIVCAITAYIGFDQGTQHPAFGVALTLAFIVMLDAASLRRKIGDHATAINQLNEQQGKSTTLRTRVGHSKVEILGGIIVGTFCAFLVWYF